MLHYDHIDQASAFLRKALDPVPDVAVVLGSGLGDFAEGLADPTVLAYAQIPNWPVSSVVGHAGRLVAGRVGGRRVIALSGRSHFYEGHTMDAVTFATRVLGHLGVKTLILTNAAGGINTRFSSGVLMLIDDHINFMGINPLVGTNEDRFGVRFPDMSEVYSARLRGLAADVARGMGLPLEHGVYVGLDGPSYETPAEIRAFRMLGADAVGMSTVPEVLVAIHSQMRVFAVSCITDLCIPESLKPACIEEIIKTAAAAEPKLTTLISRLIAEI